MSQGLFILAVGWDFSGVLVSVYVGCLSCLVKPVPKYAQNPNPEYAAPMQQPSVCEDRKKRPMILRNLYVINHLPLRMNPHTPSLFKQ